MQLKIKDMNIIPEYPDFNTSLRGTELRLESTVRFQRNGIWYEMICADLYSKETEADLMLAIKAFLKKCHRQILFYDITMNENSAGYIPPSIDQRSLQARIILSDPIFSPIKHWDKLKKGY